jgi:rod shape-determining protein MreD
VAALRWALVLALLLTALLLQLTVLPLLGLPGATPDLLLVTVAALGWAGGEVRGAVAGFVAGLALDLVPPADGVLGLSAVVLTVVGYLAGLLGERRDRGALVTIAAVALLAGGSVLGYAMLGGIVADPHVSWERVPVLVVTETLYAAVLAAFVVPAVGALVRRLEPQDTGYELGRYER